MIHSFGKCILSGEHSVLRGSKAIVFPLKKQKTSLSFKAAANTSHFFLNQKKIPLPLMDFLKDLKMIPQNFHGIFHLDSTINQKVGLGSSAALCVCFAKFFNRQGFIPKDKIFEIAKKCEDIFHGHSSGVDIAGSMAEGPLLYQIGPTMAPLPLAWKPFLYLSFSKSMASTKEAIKTAQASLNLERIDFLMDQATEKICSALASTDRKTRLNHLKQGIEEADHCFKEWGLVNKHTHDHENCLKKAGALAVKPTGSGSGGAFLSLWKNAPQTLIELIPIL